MKNESKVIGGRARAKKLTPEERSDIAKKAAIARWGEKPPVATHKGNFMDEFGINVDCYVLDNKAKSAVISQRGMAEAIGLGTQSGRSLPRFLETKTIGKYIGAELREKIDNPVVFQSFNVVQESGKGVKTFGYDVTTLIDVCKAIIEAEREGKLHPSRKNSAVQASIILNASAKLGIQSLVYALSGYDATRQEIIESFKLYVRQEAREYEKEYPEQLYNEWYRIYNLPRPPRNRPWKFMHLTNRHVYYPLANSSGKLQELITSQRSGTKGTKGKRLHQFLSEIGVKALRQHLGQLLGIAQLSNNKAEYERNFEKIFGSQPELPFDEFN